MEEQTSADGAAPGEAHKEIQVNAEQQPDQPHAESTAPQHAEENKPGEEKAAEQPDAQRQLIDDKAMKRTLRALKQHSGGDESDAIAPFSATIKHFSGLLLAHRPGETKLNGVPPAEVDSTCLFSFEPFVDVQMGRPRNNGYRIRTAEGFFLVALLGRRCTCRLVRASEVPNPGDAAHQKFFAEQTNIFQMDRKTGGLRYQHHSSANDDDVFYFAFGPVSHTEIISAERDLKKSSLPQEWKYLEVHKA
jgi:hypothetical protein